MWPHSFFPLYASLASCLIISTLKPVNYLRLANEIAFLVLAAGFTFAGHLSYWTIYHLKEQF